MAAAEILSDLSRATDPNSSPYAGAQWYFYVSGTTTPQPVYTTAALATPHAHPVVADAGGQFPNIFFDATLRYRGVLKTAGGTTVKDVDPINPALFATLGESDGAELIGFGSINVAAALEGIEVNAATYGVSATSTPSENVAAIQAALDTGASKVVLPGQVILMNSHVVLNDGQILEGKSRADTILRKTVDTMDYLVYASGKTDCGVSNLSVDGARSQTANYVNEAWCIFFNNCTRPIVDSVTAYGALTDNIVFELCVDSICIDTFSHSSNKGGFYWSACDGGIVSTCTSDDNGDDAGVGSGFIISNTWGLSLFGIAAKNNAQSQMLFSRGNRDLHVVGATLGARLQTRGTQSIYTIGETTSGTVHGVTYDGVTLYGTEDSTFSNVHAMLPMYIDHANRVDLFNVKVDSVDADYSHAVAMFKSNKVRFRGGRLQTAGIGVGIALSDDGHGTTTELFLDSVDFQVPSEVMVFDYTAGTDATWFNRFARLNGNLLGGAEVVIPTVVATTGTLPTPNGAVTIANAATPTVAELLEFCMENRDTMSALLVQLRASGVIDPDA